MKYTLAFVILIAFMLQVITASPIVVEDDKPLNKRYVLNECVPNGHSTCLTRRDIEDEGEVKDLHKRFNRNWVPKGSSPTVERRNVEKESEGPNLVKRGHRWGFGKHGFRGMFGRWHHRR